VRLVIQRVKSASVIVDGEVIGAIDHGLLVLVGVAAGDTETDLDYVASKIRGLRVFADEAGRMNRSVEEIGGAVLLVSQVTLLGDVRKGRRPGFDAAEEPGRARQLFESLADVLRSAGVSVATGRFQAHMMVTLINDGPVTILVDSRRQF
jgi:D-aminoacyl-tRNA deacylase